MVSAVVYVHPSCLCMCVIKTCEALVSQMLLNFFQDNIFLKVLAFIQQGLFMMPLVFLISVYSESPISSVPNS